MKIHWQRHRLAVVGVFAAAIAIAAVPDVTQAPRTDTAARATVEAPRQRATAAPLAAQLDMERLHRLQPMPEEATTAAATPESSGADDAGVAPVSTAAADNEVTIANAFATKSWYVPPPPPPPAKPEPPPKPTAPPLPFAYLGRYDDPGKPTVIWLLRGDRLYTVSEGDSIDAIYHIDRVAKGRIELTYLPLQQKQVLQTGESG